MENEMEIIIRRFRALLVFSGVINILCTVLFVMPITFGWYLKLLNSINMQLSWGGLPISIPSDAAHILLINTVGIDMVLISSFVIYASIDLVRRRTIILLNAITRTLFFALIVYYCIAYDIARIFLAFGILDMFVTVGQVYYYNKLRMSSVIREVVQSNDNKKKTLDHFRGLLIFSGLFNIICASPLALPFTFGWYLKLLNIINIHLNWGGVPITIPFDSIHALLINVAGLHLVLTGAIVLYASKDPARRSAIAVFNGIGRTLFFLIIVYLTYSYNILRLWLVFGVIDLLVSIGFLYYSGKMKPDRMSFNKTSSF